MSDGPRMVSRFSRPSVDRRPILILPEMMMNKRSPGAPSAIEEHVGACCLLQTWGQSPFSGENRGFPVGGPVGKVQRHGAVFVNVIVSLSLYAMRHSRPHWTLARPTVRDEST
jgi:hypothetical protein